MSGRGPYRSNKTNSHGCVGVGELDKGVWKGLACVNLTFMTCFKKLSSNFVYA